MKLNIGAGGTTIPGFTSIDLDPALSPDLVGDFRAMAFSDVEEIYAAHVLEHFFYGEALDILRQWHTWLRPGGILWLAVPDFGLISRLYAEGEEAPHLFGLLYGAADKPEWAHHFGWTQRLLNRTLLEVGFEVLGSFESWVQNADQNGADWSGAWYQKREGTAVRVSLNVKCQKRAA